MSTASDPITVAWAMQAGDDTSRIVRLWAVTMENYRQAEGDRAWAAMQSLIGTSGTSALALLMGLAMGTRGDMGKTVARIKEMAAS